MERDVDLLMEDVLAEMANPSVSSELANKVIAKSVATRSRAMENVLEFGSVGRVGTGGMSRQSLTTAVGLNIAAVLLMFAFVQSARKITAPKEVTLTALTAPPPPLPPKLNAAGGGGGNPGVAPVTHGNPPKFAPQLMPLKAPPTIAPRLTLEPTIDVQPDLKMARTDSPNFGVANSPLVGMSLGNGKGGGLGAGTGNGIGTGSGGNTGGGLRKIGGGVSAPVILFQPEPEFSEEARKAKVAGNVLIYLQVDPQGRPTHVRILRGMGMGLDEKALEAVRQYRFKPAMEDGKPVSVEMNVEVGFQIF